ncbi:MAG: hypothetical protein K2X25_08355 [Caulobacteraceae bacterium]|nr:hypothetical protein [Caulobacteraceae bacterium]
MTKKIFKAEETVSDTSSTIYTQTLTREGSFTLQLGGSAGPVNHPIRSINAVPFQHFAYYGSETAHDTSEDRGVPSGITVYEDVELIPTRPHAMPTADDVPRKIKTPGHMYAISQSVVLRNGRIRRHERTRVAGRIECISSMEFRYGGAGEEQYFLFELGADPQWITGVPVYESTGTLLFRLTNTTTGRVIRTFNAHSGLKPNQVGYKPIEAELKKYYADLVSTGDIVKVEMIHQAYGTTDNGKIAVGARSGMSLHITVPV